MKPSERVVEAMESVPAGLFGHDRANEGLREMIKILDEMREQLDELQEWRDSVKDQLL
jgi:hypothetical protein